MIEFQNNNWEDILKIFVAVGYFKKIRGFIFKECVMNIWGACWSRNITTVFIALLLDKYFIKLHYCSNIFIFLINNILVTSMIKNIIVFNFILHCILLHWHVLNVYAFWIEFRRCVCTVCLCLSSFVKEQSILLIAQDQTTERNKEINK